MNLNAYHYFISSNKLIHVDILCKRSVKSVSGIMPNIIGNRYKYLKQKEKELSGKLEY